MTIIERFELARYPDTPFLNSLGQHRIDSVEPAIPAFYTAQELLWGASTYLVETNKSGNQKGDLSYLAGTKKRSDFLIELR